MKVKMGLALQEKTNAPRGSISSLMRTSGKAEREQAPWEGHQITATGTQLGQYRWVRPRVHRAGEDHSVLPPKGWRTSHSTHRLNFFSVKPSCSSLHTASVLKAWRVCELKLLERNHQQYALLNLNRREEQYIPVAGAQEQSWAPKNPGPPQHSAGRRREEARSTPFSRVPPEGAGPGAQVPAETRKMPPGRSSSSGKL